VVVVPLPRCYSHKGKQHVDLPSDCGDMVPSSSRDGGGIISSGRSSTTTTTNSTIIDRLCSLWSAYYYCMIGKACPSRIGLGLVVVVVVVVLRKKD